MATPYQLYPMVLNNIYIGMLSLRSDQIKYFNIPVQTAAEKEIVQYIGSIKAHKRNIHSNRLDDTTPTKVKSIDRVAAVPRQRGKAALGRGGKPYKVPTDLTSTPATTSTAQDAPARLPKIRFTTFRFPGGASNAEISLWLNTKLVAHKPTYFLTPAGKSYAISGRSVPAPAPAP